MSGTKHTPGNGWYATNAGNDHQGLVIEEQTGRTVAVAYDRKDGAMLAAAPDLAAACKARLECDETFEQGTSEWSQAIDCADAMMRSALQKAGAM
jgi:hypothetical protein